MLDEKFVIVGAVISFLGGIGYVIDTLRGKTKPNRVTWFLWALAPMIAFAAELKEGVGLQALLTFMVGFNPLLIFISSFVNSKSVWKLSRLDILCGALSIVGLILWILTRHSQIAIVFSIVADALAAMPTVIKSFKYPETESSGVFLCSGTAAIITLLTIQEWTFARYAFPLYISIICAILFGLIRFRLGPIWTAKASR